MPEAEVHGRHTTHRQKMRIFYKFFLNSVAEHIHIPHADPLKTWEGTGAMVVTAFLLTVVTLLLSTEIPFVFCLLTAVIVAPVSAAAELFSHNGNDTVSVPVTIAATLFLLSLFTL